MENLKTNIDSLSKLIEDIHSQSDSFSLEEFKIKFHSLQNDRKELLRLKDAINAERSALSNTNVNTSTNDMKNLQLNKLEQQTDQAIFESYVLLNNEKAAQNKALLEQLESVRQKLQLCESLAYKDNIRSSNLVQVDCSQLDQTVLQTTLSLLSQLLSIGIVIRDKIDDVEKTSLQQEEIQAIDTYSSIDKELREWMKQTKELIDKYSSKEDIIKICHDEIFDQIRKEGQRYLGISEQILSILRNLYEDFAGKVRVYVRIKPSKEAAIFIPTLGENNRYTYISTADNTKVFGPFFNTFPSIYSTKGVYFGENEGKLCSEERYGICRAARQLVEGYHLVLSASGISGSGKTLTLFGNDQESGLSELILSDILDLLSTQAGNSGSVAYPSIRCVVELAVDQVSFLTKKQNTGKIVDLLGGKETLNPDINMPKIKLDQSESGYLQELMVKENINHKRLRKGDLNKLRKILDTYRVKRGRIKETKNNPTSSRSHLIIIISIGNGLLTVMDTAGFENAIDILQSFWKKPADKQWQLASLLGTPPLLQPYITEAQGQIINTKSADAKLYIADVVSIVREGIWINYSLLDLQTFFSNKQNAVIAKFPITRDDEYLTSASLTKNITVQNDTIGLFSLLTTLRNLQKEGRTKFVLINAIRTEKAYSETTAASLLFSQSISSTPK